MQVGESSPFEGERRFQHFFFLVYLFSDNCGDNPPPHLALRTFWPLVKNVGARKQTFIGQSRAWTEVFAFDVSFRPFVSFVAYLR